MKKLINLLLVLLSFTLSAEEKFFKEANELYANEEYLEAIEVYQKIIDEGFESAEIYYNLGNCYYKNKDWANAIWFYEKSLQKKKKKETLNNLNLTRLNIVDRIESLPVIFYKRWWNSLLESFTIKNWQILTICSIWILFLLKIFITNNNMLAHLNKFFILPVLLLCMTLSSYHKKHSTEYAIVFASNVIIKSAPTDNSTDLFSLHAGTKLEITDKIGEWLNIRLTNGNSGWLKENNCKII